MQADVGGGKARRPEIEPVERVDPDAGGHHPQASPESAMVPPKRNSASVFLIALGKRLATLAIALLAILTALLTWRHYVAAPWTRDGTVRVQVASGAPQISGKIDDVRVVDNQFVHRGDVLYTIEHFDFEVAQRTGLATVQQRAADLQVKQLESERRQHLTNLATTPEEQQIYAGNAVQAKAALDAAQQQLAQAEINLQRTKVRSPVNGYVTNLLMRVGDYARAGTSNISIIDADSYWIDGYFEETKMAGICVGDRAEAKLMGYSQPIIGHVGTVTRGISTSNAASGTQGLPNVDPVYTWVRLAQRVPARIAIDAVPPGVPLVSGMTATVTVRSGSEVDHRSWPDRMRMNVLDQLSDIFTGPRPRQNCLPVFTPQRAPTESIPSENAPRAMPPEQINPGLAPGMNLSPRIR
ncbi:multidrug transporter [Bradyrhizobium japonicum]|uniref:Multidrug transporter n=2 Tax=Bradyrhizobium japonicum TaxID=375 RepID=A0A1Y2JG31_BRAJP|nr:multidrug transporter [Bradyrhizobium japonicum]